jgi:hypothetical protein
LEGVCWNQQAEDNQSATTFQINQNSVKLLVSTILNKSASITLPLTHQLPPLTSNKIQMIIIC